MTYSVCIHSGTGIPIYVRPVDANSAAVLLKMMDKAEYYDTALGKWMPCEVSVTGFDPSGPSAMGPGH